MSVFTPDIMLGNITQIDKAFLSANNIRGLVLDVDNTLTAHGSQLVRPEVGKWIARMDAMGIKMMIVSNNTYDRVKPFADKLGLDFVSMGCKPLTVGLTKAQKQFRLPANQIAVVGDQIYTDVVAGNLKGMLTVLVKPFVMEDGAFFRMKRSLEAVHIRAYLRRKEAGLTLDSSGRLQKKDGTSS